ncbi:HIT domain-containing protein [Zavarzinia compransoris]|uniref:HIT domain-containing protein n=2 Tax=Zavarzinia compransoris TaxID=1264899 RepID=A0A317E0E5_9PROT|nr:HIT domain-containing protein [Zavarzinia compransoris]PWR20111.1 hypothetical protein DKG75_15365 [Zavarzinia compransoris]
MIQSPNDFSLDPRLAGDTIPLGDFPLSRVLMMDECRYPWVILVPRRDRLIELTDLSEAETETLWGELRQTSAAIASLGTKLNVGALGNVVAQLHIHVIARTPGDPAWPGPVWGHSPRQPWPDAQARDARAAELRARLGLAAATK